MQRAPRFRSAAAACAALALAACAALTLAACAALALAGAAAAGPGGSGSVGSDAASARGGGGAAAQGSAPATPHGSATASRHRPRVTTVARGLTIPWEIAFLPDGRALVTERPGRVRLLRRNGNVKRAPVARVPVSARGEGGLLGLAVDPRFRRNHFVYLYYTTARGMRVARYQMRGERLRRSKVILRRIAAGAIHDSGRIGFGPDRKLYIATGDAGVPDLAQRRRSRNGRFLRMAAGGRRGYRRRGGRVEVISRGHRNPQGFDWQPRTRRLVATEHGPESFDEVNVIRKGRNYGWPLVSGREHGPFRAPIALYDPSIAPSGSTFVTKRGSAWTGDYLIAALRGAQLRRLVVSRSGRVVRQRIHLRNRFGRLRAVTEAPDGSLYVLTSNRDGRGSPTAADDRILRVVPPRRR
jgi:glucose/arabinose dehydrogenase